MKNIFIIGIALLFSLAAFAQAPQKMSYQTVIRDGSNALVTNQGVGIQISILQGTAIGTAVYVERHFPTTNANGLATLEIGGGTVVSGTFSTINWGSNDYYVKTETDPNGGANYTITGISQLMSVPYALHAKVAESVIGGNSSAWTTAGNNIYNSNSGDIGIGTTTPNSKLQVNGSSTDPALRVQVAGNTKFLVNPNGGAVIGGAGSTSPTNGLYVTGDVGIGTSNPNAKLHVVSSGTSGYAGEIALTAPNMTSGETVLTFGKNTITRNRAELRFKYVASGSTSNRYEFGFSNVQPFVAFTAGEQAGIGTLSPSYKLHVNGSAGKPGGGSWTNASDKRLKDRIVPFQDGLDAILAIRPVKYHYNKLSGMDTQPEYVGVIAQELKEIAPYMVGSFEKDEETYLDVDNSAMTYMLINGMKEQQALIQKQAAAIELLQQQVEALQNANK